MNIKHLYTSIPESLEVSVGGFFLGDRTAHPSLRHTGEVTEINYMDWPAIRIDWGMSTGYAWYTENDLRKVGVVRLCR